MSEHGESDIDATEEINVDDSDSQSCSPRNYTSHDGVDRHHVSQETSECSTSPPPSQTASTRTLPNDSPRSHPFSISRLLGESGVQSLKSPSPSEEPDSDRERKWPWEEGNNNNNNRSSSGVADDGRRSWGEHDVEEKLSERDDDDTGGSTPDTQRANSSSSSSVHCTSATAAAAAAAAAADLLGGPFRLFPTGTTAGLIYTGGGVIRVPAHRPPPNGAPTGSALTQAALMSAPWSLQALQHSQQQQQQAAAAAGLHRASLLANLAAHPLQAHPHLKDRLAGRHSLFSFLSSSEKKVAHLSRKVVVVFRLNLSVLFLVVFTQKL